MLSGLALSPPPHLRLDLEKINVEWCAQNNYYDLEKINVEWSGTHLKIMSTRSWYKKNALEKNRWRVEMFTNKNVRNKTIFE